MSCVGDGIETTGFDGGSIALSCGTVEYGSKLVSGLFTPIPCFAWTDTVWYRLQREGLLAFLSLRLLLRASNKRRACY